MGVAALRRAVFFDRDGVLNEAVVREGVPHPPASVADLRVAAGAAGVVRAVRDAGWLAIVVTNQPDVARGATTLERVDAINAEIVERLGVDAIYTCPHDDADACDCRKPKPGLLLRAARDHGIDLAESFLIGDRAKDIVCGRAAGCTTIFLDRGYAETHRDPGADHTVKTLAGGRGRGIMNAGQLRIKIFADGADKAGMLEMYRNPLIAGFTTNPTLMRKAGITDFESFARDILSEIPDRPISFEVFSDDFAEMERQARLIASWGNNVYVKIPVTDTNGTNAAPLVKKLAGEGIKLNVTALLTVEQVRVVVAALAGGAPSYVSLFAGRIADAGVDPIPLARQSLEIMAPHKQLELIWASPREILNIVQADALGVHVITVTNDLLAKLPSLGKDLTQFSLETVQMFHRDAAAAGFDL